MRTVRVASDFPGSVAAAERLWYDLRRWPTFVEGFARVVSAREGWPAAGGVLTWESRPGGRGRVVERVVEHEPGGGQAAAVEDPEIRATQRIAFAALDDGVELTLELSYELKRGGPVRALVDLLFIRRAQADALRRTLARFGRELAEDREMLR